jgi:two-component system, NarL family, nitrate/nitrite response regulator NarL
VADYDIIAAGLHMLLESHSRMAVVGTAANQEDALALAALHRPDIILFDLDLDNGRGIEMLPVLLPLSRGARVVVLGGAGDVQRHRSAIALGALGLVLKEHAAETLLKVIERVHEGEAWIERSALTSMLALLL